MFVKSFLIVSFVGLCMGCSMPDFQSRCASFQDKMKEVTQGGGTPDFMKLCCIQNELVTCINDVGCEDTLAQVMNPLKQQIRQMCGSYKYEEGCLENGGSKSEPSGGSANAESEAEAEAKAEGDDDSSAYATIPSILTLITCLSVLFRIHQ